MAPQAPGPVRRVSWSELLAHDDVHEHASLTGAIGLMAFHAGLEAGTWEIAVTAAELAGASLYTVRQPAALRWHVPSSEVIAAGSATLGAWLDHVDRVIAIHGYGRHDRPWDVLVGGADPAGAAEVAAELRSIPSLRIVDDPDDMPAGLRGRHPDNPVNRARRGGVQIELPIRARRESMIHEVAAAVARVAGRWADDHP